MPEHFASQAPRTTHSAFPDGGSTTLLFPHVTKESYPLVCIMDGYAHMSKKFINFSKEIVLLMKLGFACLLCKYKGQDD